MGFARSNIHHPHTDAPGFLAPEVARAYGAPAGLTGKGVTIGVIELGGTINATDLAAAGLARSPGQITTVPVDGATPKSDPQGADGEVALDVQVIASVAPGAHQRVYFAPNTDQGFLDALTIAAGECDLVSISWGGPESSWSRAAIKAFTTLFAKARANGVTVYAAAGDAGSRDGTTRAVVDYPASDPHVIGCGGTRLSVDRTGQRTSETVWDDDDVRSATGGGVSTLFPGRQVPDIAGNADPQTGYQVVVNGRTGVIGGTSAVAPLYAALHALLLEGLAGHRFDMVNTLLTNPTTCYDVTVGDNGDYRAGVGRVDTTGLGVVDVGKLLAVLGSGAQIPAPGGTPAPPGGGSPAPAPAELAALAKIGAVRDDLTGWLAAHQ